MGEISIPRDLPNVKSLVVVHVSYTLFSFFISAHNCPLDAKTL